MKTSLPQARLAIMLVFASFGAVVGALAGAMPLVTTAARITPETQGLSLTLMGLAAVIVMSLAGAYGQLTSNRNMLLLTLPLSSLALLLILTAQSPWFFITMIILLGAWLGAMDLFMNAEASIIEHHSTRPVFTSFHAAASAGLAVFALLSSFLSYYAGPLATGLSVALLQAIAGWQVWRGLTPHANPKARDNDKPPSAPILYRPLILMGLAVGLTIACEGIAIYWSANLLAEQAPQLAAIAGLGIAFFGLCNVVMRLQGDRLRHLFGNVTVLIISMVTAILSFMALVFSTHFTFSVLAFAGVGFGLSLIIPTIYGMAAATVPANRAKGLSYLSAVAGPLRIIIPWAFGLLAASYTTSAAFGGCALLMLLALSLILILRGRKNNAP